jgi:hypothetical protein
MKIKILILLLVSILLSSCSINDGREEDEQQATLTPTFIPTETLTLEEAANEVINALAAEDMDTVAEFVHPEQGV